MTPQEIAERIASARQVKVAKLEIAARRCEITSIVMAQMTDEQWAMLEKIADVRPASLTTREETIKALESSEKGKRNG